MGQRHQAFLITRVRWYRTWTYRCIAALHAQWCWGAEPLRSVHRFLALLRHKLNAAVVRSEISALNDQYHPNQPFPEVPCPYTASLMAHAWFSTLTEEKWTGVVSHVHILDANRGCWDSGIWNDDGITVIDVTNLADPRYCFIGQNNNDHMQSAYEFLALYHPLHDIAPAPAGHYMALPPGTALTEVEDYMFRVEGLQSIFAALCNLTGVPIVSVEVLREVWPGETFRERRRHDPASGVEINVTRSTPSREEAPYIEVAKRYLRERDALPVDEIDETEEQRQAEELLRRIRVPATESETLEALLAHHSLLCDLLRRPSLFGFFFARVAVPIVREPSLDDYMLFFLLDGISDATPIFCSREHGDPVNFRVHWWMIEKSIRAKMPWPLHGHDQALCAYLAPLVDTFLDLSGWSMSPTQVIYILCSFPRVDTLDLSENLFIEADDIPVILAAAPALRRLIIVGCDGIDETRLVFLLKERPWLFRTLEGLVHPILLSLTKTQEFPIAFTFVFRHLDHTTGVSMPFLTPTHILRSIVDVLSLMWGGTYYSTYRHKKLGSTLLWPSKQVGTGEARKVAAKVTNVLVSAGVMAPDDRWNSRPVVSVPLRLQHVASDHPSSGSWAFLLEWVPMQPESAACGLLRYMPNHIDDNGNRYASGTVYDLQGFLRCMADEGRPLPDVDLIERVEELLYAKDQSNGQVMCPVLDPDEVPMMDTHIAPEQEPEGIDIYVDHTKEEWNLTWQGF
ncbi:hypothetical protein C8Q76DRAFT_791472 [Earliella scabrosa]|nr:hypothetical protein C8Q76DRAFT_791472 [Earliella scabrosa]